jgi:hypothetical protein
MRTILTKYAEDNGLIVLPNLIEGKVCLYNERTHDYTLYAMTKYTSIKDDFNPDDYCVLHNYFSTIGYSTPLMRRSYRVKKAYDKYKASLK